MKRKKLYYVPGLISLLGLPILLLFLSPKNKIQETCIKFFLPSDERPAQGTIDYFSKYKLYKEVEKKKVIGINVNDFFIDDKGRCLHYAKFNFIHNEMGRLQFTSDTSTVFKIEIGDENTYGEFVWIINQCLVYNYKRYAFADNNFYLFPNPPQGLSLEGKPISTFDPAF